MLAAATEANDHSNEAMSRLRATSDASEADVRATLLHANEASRSILQTSFGDLGPSSIEVTKTSDASTRLKGLLREISQQSRSAIKAGEDKVALAITLYDWIDRHIRRVDSDLLKHEESLSLGLRPGTVPSIDAQIAQAHATKNGSSSGRAHTNGTLGSLSMHGAESVTASTSHAVAAGMHASALLGNGGLPKQPGRWITIPKEAEADPNEVRLPFCP